MAKKSLRYLNKMLNRFEKQLLSRNKASSQTGSSIDLQLLIKDLISVDSMLCNSSSIACNQFQSDPNKLLEIIKNHHIGLEVVLSKIGIKIERSEPGCDFDPEFMHAHSLLKDTDNPDLHGKVAISVTPRFIQVKPNDSKESILQHECVILYKYIGK